MRPLLVGAAAVAGALLLLHCGGSEFTASPQNGADGGGGDGGGPQDGGGTTDGAIPPTGPVSGRVVDAHLLPLGNVSVRIGGQMTTTAQDGSFSIPEVARPYDAFIAPPMIGQRRHGYAFIGLTRSDPTLQLVADLQAQVRSTTISANVTWAQNATNGVLFADLMGVPLVDAAATAMNSSMGTAPSISPQWLGPPSAPARVFALQWEIDQTTNQPKHFSSYTISTTTAQDGSPGNVQSSPNDVAADDQLRLTATPPSGYQILGGTLYFRPDPSSLAAALIATEKPITPMLSRQFTTPRIPQSSFVACASAAPLATNTVRVVQCKAGVGSTQDVSLALPAPPALAMPADGASVPANATFSYAPFANGIQLVLWKPADSQSPAPEIYVITAGGSAQIPDMSALGFGPPTNLHYTWTVDGLGPFTTTDSAAGPGGYASFFVAVLEGRGPPVDGAIGSTDSRTVSFQ